MMLDDSKDEVIKPLKPILKTGKKWKVRDIIRSAKDNLAFKEIIGHIQTRTQGFGTKEKQRWSKTIGKNRRDMVIQDVKNEVDNKRFLKGVQQFQQGQWTKWAETLKKSITWNDIWQIAPLRLSFLIRSKFDQLSSKNNLFRWKKENDPTCPQCNDKPQTLEHVLNSYKIALGNRRYTWRHNRVLEELAKA